MAGPTDQPVGGAAGQRRILALLVLLGVAGDAGLSRDKLTGLLWPEMDAERARHSLTQTLYAARRAVGVDDLFVTGGDVRLNAARIRCDAQRFEAAIDAGELEQAVALYLGPFLDGFFYTGSTEFEQWALLTRARLEGRAATAHERLAESAEEAGDLRAAVEWRRRLAALRPLDGAHALRLMEALAASGDRAGALQHARVHELLIRDALGLAPDPAIAALGERLRDADGWTPPPRFATPSPASPRLAVVDAPPVATPAADHAAVVRPAPERATTALPRERLTAVRLADPADATHPATDDATHDAMPTPGVTTGDVAPDDVATSAGTIPPAGGDADPSVPRPVTDDRAIGAGAVTLARDPGREVAVVVARPSGRGRRLHPGRRPLAWLVAAILVAAAGLGGALRWGRRTVRVAPATAPLRQPVVVAPFRVTGASASLAYLRDGMVELLSTRLGDDSGARAVDPGAVLSAWRATGLGGTVDAPRDSVVRLAARLGAERVIVGSVVGNRDHAVVTATAVAVPSGRVTGEATVEGPADSVTALVDRLAARLLVVEAGEDASLANQTTTSLPALRAFLAGQSAFRRGDYTAALRRFGRALQDDSTFALAALQMVRAADRLGTVAPRERALALAWQHRDALGAQDAAILDALAGPRYPSPSPASDQLAAWERLAALTPGRADAWYELGAHLFHHGATLGIADARPRAAAALRRALALDSTFAPARQLLAQLASTAPPTPAAGPLPDDTTLARTAGALAPFVQWRAALARDDAAALRRAHDVLPRLGPANLRAIAQSGQFDAAGLDDARQAVRTLVARAGDDAADPDAWEALMADHSLSLNEGRLRDARAAADRLDLVQPDPHASLRLRLLDALYGDAGRPAADEAALALGRALGDSSGRLGSVRVATPLTEQAAADLCVLAQARIAAGDTAGVGRVLATLRARSDTPVTSNAAAAGTAACAELVDAAVAVVARRAGAASTLARVDSLGLTRATAGDAIAYAPILLGRLHARLGDPVGALEAVRRRGYMIGWPRYLATAWRDEGRYAAAVGDRDGARTAYARYLALRTQPDSALADAAAGVRRELDALREPVADPPVGATRDRPPP